MNYDELDRYVDSFDAPRWLKKTRAEIWRLLGIKDLTESSQIIKFYYYKTPFEEDAKEDAQRQIIAFTNSGLIIIGTPVFDSMGRTESVELQTARARDIQKLVLKASVDDPDYVVALEVVMKDGSRICLDSNDANTRWTYAYAQRIREIARYLLDSISLSE